MSTYLARQAIRAWPNNPFATKKQIKHIRAQWIAKVEQLGDRYLLAKANYVQRRTPNV